MNNFLFIPIIFLALVYLAEARFPHIYRKESRLRHTADNLMIAGMGGLINIIFLLTLTALVADWAQSHSLGFLNISGLQGMFRFMMAIILFDLWMYIWHRMNHQILLLWRLHRAHHNDVSMDSTTALRFHPIEIIISQILNLGIIVLVGLKVSELLLYNMILQMVIFLHHSNVRLPEKVDRFLRAVLVTPNMHRVHHSIETHETNSNYSSIFSFWDRLLGSFLKRQETKGIVYGIDTFREPGWQRVRGFLRIPFIK